MTAAAHDASHHQHHLTTTAATAATYESNNSLNAPTRTRASTSTDGISSGPRPRDDHQRYLPSSSSSPWSPSSPSYPTLASPSTSASVNANASASASASTSASLPPGASYAPSVPLWQPHSTATPSSVALPLPRSLVPGGPVRSASLPVTTADSASISTQPPLSDNLSPSTIPRVSTSPLRTESPAPITPLSRTDEAADPVTNSRPSLPPPITTATAAEHASGSMAGVGRSSVLRNAPLLGPAPTSASTSSPAASPTMALPSPFSASTSPPLEFIEPPRPVAALPPPHLVPQPEVCVECMMRDKDMDDVDVTGPHVWDRDSDIDFEDALRWDDELAATMTNSDHHKMGGSEESGSLGAHGSINGIRRTGGSRESATGPSSYGHVVGGASSMTTRKRIGRGHPLTTAGLKLWTSMNPPASAHRWRTLQTYLATQVHFNELHRQKREAQQQHNDVRGQHYDGDSYQLPVSSSAVRPSSVLSAGSGLAVTSSSPAAAGPSTFIPRHHQARSSSPWKGSGHLPIDAMDERMSHSRGPSQSRVSLQIESTSSPPIATAYDHRSSSMSMPFSTPSLPPLQTSTAAASVLNYSHGDQPWLSNPRRRSSNPILSTSSAQTNGASASPNLCDRASTSTTPSPSTGFASFASRFGRSSTDLRSISSRPNSTRATAREGADGGSPPPHFGHPPSSPGRAPSFLYPQDDRSSLNTNRRGSTWSKFRQSASQSVLSFAPSFAPSGSMVEMHLGLEADRYQHGQHGLVNYQHHHARSGILSSTMTNYQPGGGHHPYLDPGYPSMSDSYVARHPHGGNDASPYVDEKLLHRDAKGELLRGKESEKETESKKKNGLKGFFSKLVGGGGNDKKQSCTSLPPASTRGDLLPRHQTDFQVPTRSNGRADPKTVYDFYGTAMGSLPTSEELAPPPPLSTLAKEPNSRRLFSPSMNSLSKTRSTSASSIDSLGGVPYTPPLAPSGPPMNGHRPSSIVATSDRRSITSYTSSRSKFMPPPISTTTRHSFTGNTPTVISTSSGQSWSRLSTEDVLIDTRTPKSFPNLANPPTNAWEPHNRSSSSVLDSFGPPPPIPSSAPYGTDKFARSARSLFSSSKSQSPSGATTPDETRDSGGSMTKKSKTRSKLFHFGSGGSTGAKRRSSKEKTTSTNNDFDPGAGYRTSSRVIY
ncbi:BQ2448_7528 [Microbotryum intermedium]|uniref:BQ2448_7528 protein n=1 Tax=Microbotryum intermedium TaxID=269621 RepID=A0A238FIJ4_9BASI|nr:BQ2448_7528 [Microbotryum intermedium]